MAAKKFHEYTLQLSTGRVVMKCYSFMQAQKNTLVEIMEVKRRIGKDISFGPKLDDNGQPITASIVHEWVEFDNQAEAVARGLKPVLPGELKPFVKNYVAAAAPRPTEPTPVWLWHGGFELRECTPAAVAQMAEATESEASQLEEQAKRMREHARVMKLAAV